MSTSTQYNPQHDLDRQLLSAGASKTVYALITPETEASKMAALGYGSEEDRLAFFAQFREAWTGKQDAYHREFFDEWHEWSKPVINLDREGYPYTYPTAGASEPIRQIIFDFKARGGTTIHVFKGEYEGYKAMGEAANLKVVEWDRDEPRKVAEAFADSVTDDLFFISQPSAIDGNVWDGFNQFIYFMPTHSVVADVTYVGAVPASSITERFDMNPIAIRNVVFSLSKPFGAYYDRIGGVFCRKEDKGLFGNKWFKSLTALSIGRRMLRDHHVFDIPERYRELQERVCRSAGEALDLDLRPCDIYILATGDDSTDAPLQNYIRRAGKLRICLSKAMAKELGTAES